MYCPKCRAEFVEGVSRCAACQVALVTALPEADLFASPDRMAKALAGKALEAIVVGNHVALKEAQQFLADHHIPSVMAGEADGEEPQAAGMHSRFFLMIEAEQLEPARQLFRERWQKGLQIEGLMLKDEAGSADACPACGAAVPDSARECADCGLFLGDPDAIQ